MKTDFDEFKAAFDSYLDLCEEPVEGILFLRYEDLEAASHLHTIQDEGFTPIVALQDHIDTLTDCQNYAVEHGVTSTYIFFKSHSYQQWLNAREWVDSPAHRAQWLRSKSMWRSSRTPPVASSGSTAPGCRSVNSWMCLSRRAVQWELRPGP